MAGWTRHEGRAVHLAQDNVDTDQIIPARFMSTPRSEGYADYLMHDLRRDDDGALREDFALNATPEASILLAGRNFGSGSSREAAVYALVDAGFRVVIAESFGDIFAANAVNNGLLPAVLPEKDIARLAAAPDLAVDLDSLEVTTGAESIGFDLDARWREKLMQGWDDIDLTLQHREAIAAFRADRRQIPGAWPRPPSD